MPRYEFSDGSSNKFWEITLDGTSFTTTYGRIGTDGQSSMKEFDSDEKAQKEHDKLVAEKVKKGYLPVGGGAKAAAKAAPAKAAPAPAKAAPAPAKAAAKPAAGKKKPVFDDEGDDEEEEAPKAKAAAKPAAKKSGGARRFEFVEGTSSKFWEVTLDGTSVNTRYGKIGTDGQMTAKDLGSDEKAKKEYDKLVGEKTKKGYVEK